MYSKFFRFESDKMNPLWENPTPYKLVISDDPNSFSKIGFKSHPGDMRTVLPLNPHPGSFGFVRKMHIHEGVDLYVPQGTPVSTVEAGEVVAVLPFTGAHVEKIGKPPSPWWLETYAILIEGDSGVVVYGEIGFPALKVGTRVPAGEYAGNVTRVLATDKGRPTTMLHLELHRHGTRMWADWVKSRGEDIFEFRPTTLKDPTPHLMRTALG